MKFFARAPGKIIITGEHFVVHGSFALAAAIHKGALVTAETSDGIEVSSRELDLVASNINKVPLPLKPTVEAIKATFEFLGEKKGIKVSINSDLPISSGLGSSSSVAVATVAATSSALGQNLSQEEIINLAMTSEGVTHGKPSGIDVNVAVYGGVILFKIGEKVKQIELDKEVEFIIGYSGIKRQTSKMIAKFSDMERLYPNIFTSLVFSSSCLTETATNALIKYDLTTLGSIMNFFHVVLSQMGASRKELDNIIEKALESGCIGAKLTGAGGGGCIIALPIAGEARIVAQRLKKNDVNISIVKIPCEGVKVWKNKN